MCKIVWQAVPNGWAARYIKTSSTVYVSRQFDLWDRKVVDAVYGSETAAR